MDRCLPFRRHWKIKDGLRCGLPLQVAAPPHMPYMLQMPSTYHAMDFGPVAYLTERSRTRLPRSVARDPKEGGRITSPTLIYPQYHLYACCQALMHENRRSSHRILIPGKSGHLRRQRKGIHFICGAALLWIKLPLVAGGLPRVTASVRCAVSHMHWDRRHVGSI